MKTRNLRCAAVVCALFFALSAGVSAQELATEEEKILYAVGMAVGQNLGQFSLTAEE